MNLRLFAALASVMFVFAASVRAQSAPDPKARITVSAVGSVVVRPEKARLSLSIVTRGGNEDTAADVLRLNSEAATKVVAALRTMGVTDEEIDRQDARLSTRQNYARDGDGFLGYEANNRIVLTTARIEEVGAIVSAAVQAGANQFQNVEHVLADEKGARDEALRNAARAAREDAQTLAEGAGVRIERLLNLELERRAGPSNYSYSMAPRSLDDEGEAPVPLAPGMVRVTARVKVVFEVSEAQPVLLLQPDGKPRTDAGPSSGWGRLCRACWSCSASRWA